MRAAAAVLDPQATPCRLLAFGALRAIELEMIGAPFRSG
jgi:hypothetical protein